MSLGDKITDLGGKAKETAGQAAGDDELRAEGQADQAKAGLSEAVDKVKDAAGDAVDQAKDLFKK
jgi:uncharacterized protein YjbJ (UPF0337 family)